MTKILIEACAADDITALDLQREIQENDGDVIKCYRLTELDGDGYRNNVTGSLLWFPEHHRAAIEWGADADWTDADSPKHAVRLWQSGEMVA